jgi:hypothetical protein
VPAVQQYTPDDGPCETETCRVVKEGHGVDAVEPGISHKSALKTVFVYTLVVLHSSILLCRVF